MVFITTQKGNFKYINKKAIEYLRENQKLLQKNLKERVQANKSSSTSKTQISNIEHLLPNFTTLLENQNNSSLNNLKQVPIVQIGVQKYGL